MKKITGLFSLLLLAFLGTAVCTAQPTVDVYGQVRIYNGTCDTGIGMNGVTVILTDSLTGQSYTTETHTDAAFMAAHNLTSPLGIYYFDNVLYSTRYKVEVILPLGVTAATNSSYGAWWNANPRIVGTNFYRCFLMVLGGTNFAPHTQGYWKHQAQVAVTGNGNAQVPEDELIALLQMVHDLFDDAQYFPVYGVTSISATNRVALQPENALATFNLPNGGSAGMVNKAKKQLLALLLNVTAEYVYVWQDISADDRTISQALSFGANMITSNGANLETAKDAMDYINNAWAVPGGWIPSSYGLVYYGDPAASFATSAQMPESAELLSNYPNPFNPETTIQFTLPQSGMINLAIYDLSGREVAKLVEGWREAGTQEAVFNAADLASGIYLARLVCGESSATMKMTLVK